MLDNEREINKINMTKGFNPGNFTPDAVNDFVLTDNSLRIKPREAWAEGTNIRTAVKHNPEIVRGWIMAEVGRLIKDVDANKTISSNEELQFCCRSILEEHPTLNLKN